MGLFLDIATLVKDIVTAADEGHFDKDGNALNNLKARSKRYSSISHRATEGTLQFPVLISSSIDIETAQNISKALERNYSTFAQIAFSHTPTDTWNKGWSSADYLRNFHQNTGIKTDRHDLANAINHLMDSYNVYEDDRIVVFSATYESATTSIQASNKEQLFDVMEHVRHDILNNKYTPKAEVIYNFRDQGLNQKYNSIMREASDINKMKGASDAELKRLQAIHGARQDAANYKLNRDKFRHSKSRDQANDQFNKDKFEYSKGQDKLSARSVDLNRDMLRDNDVKKSNELVATTLHVRIRLVNKKDEDMGVVDFIVGIKCILHPIKSNDMITNMVNACRNDNTVFNFLRWTTGEISFFRDFLLNINEIETDVTSYRTGASPWWSALKRRKSMSRFKDTMFINKRILPNATIVISAEEAEFIKSEYGYDLYNPVFFNKIMNHYFLLGFVIVDNSSQIAHFLFEDQTNFQTVTFSALEKSSVNDERKFKEMLKVVNRV